jgi:hypothetical protein
MSMMGQREKIYVATLNPVTKEKEVQTAFNDLF